MSDDDKKAVCPMNMPHRFELIEQKFLYLVDRVDRMEHAHEIWQRSQEESVRRHSEQLISISGLAGDNGKLGTTIKNVEELRQMVKANTEALGRLQTRIAVICALASTLGSGAIYLVSLILG